MNLDFIIQVIKTWTLQGPGGIKSTVQLYRKHTGWAHGHYNMKQSSVTTKLRLHTEMLN